MAFPEVVEMPFQGQMSPSIPRHIQQDIPDRI